MISLESISRMWEVDSAGASLEVSSPDWSSGFLLPVGISRAGAVLSVVLGQQPREGQELSADLVLRLVSTSTVHQGNQLCQPRGFPVLGDVTLCCSVVCGTGNASPPK